MKYLKSMVLCGLAIVVGLGVLPAIPASAASESSALSINPRKDYTAKQGETIKDKIVVRNIDGNSDLKLTLRVIDFTYTDDTGTPKLLLGENEPKTTWSLKQYLTAPESVTVKPNESKTIPIKLTMPDRIGAGSYYSAIIYSSGTSTGENSGLNASGVTLVFVTVPGKVDESLSLEKLGPYNNAEKKYQGYFTTKMPDRIGYTLKNSGNVAEKPVGSIVLTDLFGNETRIDDINPVGSLALIGQTRTFMACLKTNKQDVNFEGNKTEESQCAKSNLWPGHYRVSLDVFYGQNGNVTREVVGSAGFWYLPVWFLAILLVVLSVISFYIWKIVRKVRDPQRRARRR